MMKSAFLEEGLEDGLPGKSFRQWLIDDSVTHLFANTHRVVRYKTICPKDFIWMLCGTPVTNLNLSSFSLVDNDVVNEIVEALPFSNINTLNLCNNFIGDVGAKALSKVLPLTKIISLDISKNKISKPLEGELERLVQRNRDKKYAEDNAYLFATLRYRMARLNKVIPEPEEIRKNIRNSIRMVSLWVAGNQLTVKERNEVLEAGRIISKLPKGIVAHVLSFLLGGKGQSALTSALNIYDRVYPNILAESIKSLELNTGKEKEAHSVASRALNRKYPAFLFSPVPQDAIEMIDIQGEEALAQSGVEQIFRI
jgi:Leucine-rich repeat (LRR) protein